MSAPGPVVPGQDASAGVRVRRATQDDLDAVAEIERRARRGADREQLVLALVDPERVVVVATVDDQVVGWGKTHRWSYADGPAPVGHYLGGVTVDPGFRRGGVGSALTRARMDWVAERAGFVCCVVNATNVASLALHEGLGFREVARAASFHTIRFTGGSGVLLRAELGTGRA
ncbi:GNAT family N-acetyltransferase [Oerskovia jenensis]|uniref:Ribosomal protein S18 acetylase RimI-like enzyme n=1 Tax=Oerskovia jenensis TaxID=162169 RepID=A0ABS2LK79_9CELL|nr:GNAT family N-acetyltransferase [Oerskovia jenensis]MBM7480848.1 ribosomal protein S18 acetylase RimI-like enzyme [Oerskovia jenensis]